MSNAPDNGPLKITLCESRGETSTFIDAAILENGDLQLSGRDFGKAPLEHFGDIDYEYWLTVPSEHKDQLLLELLNQLYQGDIDVDTKLMDVLKAKSIPYKFDNYI